MSLFSPVNFSADIFFSTMLDSQANARISVLYALLTALLLGTWYRIAAVPRHKPKRSIRQLANPKIVCACILLVAALQYTSSYLITAVYYIRPAWYKTYVDLLESAGMTEMSVLLAFYSIIIGPVCEELIFRGVTFHYAHKALPFWAANILQALLFGIYHANMVQGIYAFCVGLMCGCIFYYGKSIYLSILFHILFNFWGTYLGKLMYQGSNSMVQLLLIAATVAAGIIGFRLFKDGVRSRDTFRQEAQ